MTVTLINKVNRPQTFNLIHQRTPKRVRRFDYDHVTGARKTKIARISLAGSLTLLARETRGALPNSVAKEPDVVTAKDLGLIRVIHVAEDPKPAAPARSRARPTPQPTSRETLTRGARPPETQED